MTNSPSHNVSLCITFISCLSKSHSTLQVLFPLLVFSCDPPVFPILGKSLYIHIAFITLQPQSALCMTTVVLLYSFSYIIIFNNWIQVRQEASVCHPYEKSSCHKLLSSSAVYESSSPDSSCPATWSPTWYLETIMIQTNSANLCTQSMSGYHTETIPCIQLQQFLFF